MLTPQHCMDYWNESNLTKNWFTCMNQSYFPGTKQHNCKLLPFVFVLKITVTNSLAAKSGPVICRHKIQKDSMQCIECIAFYALHIYAMHRMEQDKVTLLCSSSGETSSCLNKSTFLSILSFKLLLLQSDSTTEDSSSAITSSINNHT